jgi:hypothetical protein
MSWIILDWSGGWLDGVLMQAKISDCSGGGTMLAGYLCRSRPSQGGGRIHFWEFGIMMMMEPWNQSKTV